MMSANALSYDLVVIGGGSAGLTAAKFAATFGKSAVIIEQAKLGGDCTWTGCVPSKALLKSASVAQNVRKANQFGINVNNGDNMSVDMKAIKERIKKIQTHIYEEDDSKDVLLKLGVETIEGKAFFEDRKSLKVTGNDGGVQYVRATDGIVIATGAGPKIPSNNIPGLDTIRYITYEEVFDLDFLPERMTVVGGGPIGSELSQAFARLGSQVTQIAPRLLPNDEPEAGEALEKVFNKEGITRVVGRLKSVSSDGLSSNGKHIATCISTDGSEQVVSGDIMLVAVGRAPVVNGMGLEKLGIKMNKDGLGIAVDATLKTSVKGIYAAGDCTGVQQFTHYAGFQGAVAARNILLPLTDSGLYQNVPATTFTEPEVASIGLTEAQAIKLYSAKKISTRFVPISNVDRAECSSESDGFIKIIYDSKTYKILGSTIMSTAAGEMISEIAVAMKTNLKLDQLATVMHAYPTYSFALQVLAAEIYYEKLQKSKKLLNVLKKMGL